MRKIATTFSIVAIALTLAGCGIVDRSVSYEAGRQLGEIVTQDQLNVIANGDINDYCQQYVDAAEQTGGIDDFSPEDFINGCKDGYKG